MFNLSGIYTYEDMLSTMQRGMSFYKTFKMRTGEPTLWRVLSADEKYIRWSYYGSSSNLATPEELAFVIEQIFNTDINGFLRKYILH